MIIDSVEYPGINPDNTLRKFATPKPTLDVCIAAANGDLSTLESKEERGLGEVDEHGNTALIWAADKGHVDVVKFILQKDLTWMINHRGYLGNTAIARAARGGHASTMEALLSHPLADPNICNDKMQYPLHFAAFKKHPEMVQIMLQSGKCDTMVKDRKGRTPAEDTSVDQIRNSILQYRTNKTST